MYIDFHTHILPGIDDGAKTLEDALSMLSLAKKSGAELVVLTPHYLWEESIDAFLEKRNAALLKFQDAARESGDTEFPSLCLGAEVMFDRTLENCEGLEKLCISGTNRLLLELPGPSVQSWHITEAYHLMAKRNILPVFVHIERYLNKPKALSELEELVTIGAKFQVNASSYLNFSGKRVIDALAKQYLISAIGSDAHSLKWRNPDISRAVTKLSKRFGNGFLRYVKEQSEELLEGAKTHHPLSI